MPWSRKPPLEGLWPWREVWEGMAATPARWRGSEKADCETQRGLLPGNGSTKWIKTESRNRVWIVHKTPNRAKGEGYEEEENGRGIGFFCVCFHGRRGPGGPKHPKNGPDNACGRRTAVDGAIHAVCRRAGGRRVAASLG